MDVAQRFMDLFTGSDKTYGQWNPANVKPDTKMFTVKKKVTINEFKRHLNGEFGLGCVPVNSEGMCNWAAIDIDSHHGEVVDINTISRSIFSKGIPLVPCRSKSGGVHCYMFTSEPIPAVLVKKVLTKWAEDIGFGGSEIFPKQVSTRDNNTGNWLNLAYYDAKDTVRYSVEIEGKNAKKLDVEQFIERAETCKLSKSMLRSFILSGHEQAPPCIQELMIDGNVIDEKVEFNRLVHKERINHIISNLDYYGYSGNRPRGLIFCSRNDEASKLSAKFNERGFRTVA